MQKINKNASILLWTIFLSIIISIAFIWVSTKINQKLQKNNSSLEEKSIKNNIENKLSSKDFTNETFSNWESIYFEESKQFQTSLKENETIEIWTLEWAIDISLSSWWPIFYSVSWTIVSSWIIEKNDIIQSSSWSIIIKNLWWNTKLNLKSENSLILDEQKYNIVQIIWNKKILKKSWTVSK